MKKIFTYPFFLLLIGNIQAQTTFSFIGDGDWTDATQWENGNAPGITIDADDTVQIFGTVTIPSETNITNSGTLETFSSADGNTPTIIVQGALINNNNINFSRATVTIESTGDLSSSNENAVLTITNNSILTNFGSVTMFAGSIRLTSLVSSLINEQSFIMLPNTSLEILSGNFINGSENNTDLTNVSLSNSGSIINNGRSFTNRGELSNTQNGMIISSGDIDNEETGILSNAGIISINEFLSTLSNLGTFSNINMITIEDDARIINSSPGIFTNQSDGTIMNNGDIENDSNFVNAGMLINEGTVENVGTISNSGTFENNNIYDDGTFGFNQEFINSGTLSGINTSHSVTLENIDGILSPGNSVSDFGIYTIDGFLSDYVQGANATLNIDLGGTVAGNTYDQVTVGDDVTSLDGTLNVSLLNDFAPEIGDSFTVLLPDGSLSGTFATVNLPELPEGRIWDDVSYSSANGVVITVIENPVLSVTDFNNQSNFQLYPNPTVDKINIQGLNDIVDAEIFTLDGKKVISTTMNSTSKSINVESLETGIYILNIENSSYRFMKK